MAYFRPSGFLCPSRPPGKLCRFPQKNGVQPQKHVRSQLKNKQWNRRWLRACAKRNLFYLWDRGRSTVGTSPMFSEAGSWLGGHEAKAVLVPHASPKQLAFETNCTTVPIYYSVVSFLYQYLAQKLSLYFGTEWYVLTRQWYNLQCPILLLGI